MEIHSRFKPTAVRDGIVEAIRLALLDGKFQPGQPINERKIAEMLGVSGGPVREALLILTAEGLMTHTQNYGFSVIQLSRDELGAMAEVRIPLEGMALRLARNRVKDDDLKELAQLRDQIMEDISKKIVPARADEAFHRRIAELSGNVWLAVALHRILGPFFASQMIPQLAIPPTEQVMLEQHDAYLNYLRGAGTMSPEECVKFHMFWVESLVKGKLSSS